MSELTGFTMVVTSGGSRILVRGGLSKVAEGKKTSVGFTGVLLERGLEPPTSLPPDPPLVVTIEKLYTECSSHTKKSPAKTRWRCSFIRTGNNEAINQSYF